jgi:hypothetical protein
MGEACNSGTRRRGPDPFTDLDPRHHIKKILAKDCGEDCGEDCGKDNVDEWSAVEPPPDLWIAVLQQERISGYEFRESVDRELRPGEGVHLSEEDPAER